MCFEVVICLTLALTLLLRVVDHHLDHQWITKGFPAAVCNQLARIPSDPSWKLQVDYRKLDHQWISNLGG